MEDSKRIFYAEGFNQFGKTWRHFGAGMVGTVLFVDNAVEVSSYTARVLPVEKKLGHCGSRIFFSVSFRKRVWS